MRVFAAIAFYGAEAFMADLSAAMEHYRKNTRSGRFVPVANLHLTLKFFGEVPDSRIEEICGCLDRAAAGCAPFVLRTGRPGSFARDGAHVLWIGLEGDTVALGKLQASVEAAVAQAGFPREKRGFSPHITLARDAVFTAGPHLRSVPGYEPRRENLAVRSIVLMESAQTNGRTVYRPVREFMLRG